MFLCSSFLSYIFEIFIISIKYFIFSRILHIFTKTKLLDYKSIFYNISVNSWIIRHFIDIFIISLNYFYFPLINPMSTNSIFLVQCLQYTEIPASSLLFHIWSKFISSIKFFYFSQIILIFWNRKFLIQNLLRIKFLFIHFSPVSLTFHCKIFIITKFLPIFTNSDSFVQRSLLAKILHFFLPIYPFFLFCQNFYFYI